MASPMTRTPRRAIDPHDEIARELRSMARYERRRARLTRSPEMRALHLMMAADLSNRAEEAARWL